MELKALPIDAIKVWEPTLSLTITPDELLEQPWRAMCFREQGTARTVFVEVTPSREHNGFVHYEVWDVTGQQSWKSKKPVMCTHVADFIDFALRPLGYDVSELTWKRIEKPQIDREAIEAAKETEYVYFLGAGPFVKIGKATGHPAARIADLRTGCPFPITLIASITGGLKEEFALHKRFAEYRAHGEWFRHEGALAEHIKSLSEVRA